MGIIGSDGTHYVPGGTYLFAIDPYGSIKWLQYAPSYQTTPCLASDGTKYVGSSNANLYAIDLVGSVKWIFATGGSIYSSPTLDEHETIYFGSTDYNLYAIYPTGSIAWSYYMYSSIRSSPAIGRNGIVYVGTEGGSLYAVHPNGQLAWTTATSTGQFDVSSPVINPIDGSIYIGSISSDRSLYAFSPNGSIKWTFAAQIYSSIYATAALTVDGNIIFSSSGDNNLYCLHSNGTLKWKFLASASTSYSPTVGSNNIIYFSADSLYAIYPTGSLMWKTLINNYPKTVVISSNGIIYSTFGSSIYAIGTLLSSQSPSLIPPAGLVSSDSPKFQGNLQNTVIL
jgi:outer membrane protein assembly factor BamB